MGLEFNNQSALSGVTDTFKMVAPSQLQNALTGITACCAGHHCLSKVTTTCQEDYMTVGLVVGTTKGPEWIAH
jgi:hypothetical protein